MELVATVTSPGWMLMLVGWREYVVDMGMGDWV
jgi:hypothetical protein